MDKKIRWGILGTGWIAEKMVEALSVVNDASLVAVGSRTAEKANEFARKYHVEKRTDRMKPLPRILKSTSSILLRPIHCIAKTRSCA